MVCSQDRHQDGMSVWRIGCQTRIALAAAGLDRGLPVVLHRS